MHGCPGSEHMHFNLEHRLYTLQIYVVWKSQVEIGHTFMEIHCRFYRLFLNRNAIPFYFRFLQEMLPHLLSYSKRGLFRLKNCDDFPRCFFLVGSKTLCVMHEKCPNTEVFLVPFFPHSGWIRRNNPFKDKLFLIDKYLRRASAKWEFKVITSDIS